MTTNYFSSIDITIRALYPRILVELLSAKKTVKINKKKCKDHILNAEYMIKYYEWLLNEKRKLMEIIYES